MLYSLSLFNERQEGFVRIFDSEREKCPQPDGLPIFPRGITGFGGADTEPTLFLDEKVFHRMCYALARANGGTVAEVDTDITTRNFYFAKICRYGDFVFLLQNAHAPYAAFARQDTSGGFVLTQQPEWLQVPEGPVRFLSLAEQNQDWHGLCGELSPEELEQIRYWNAQTVGEIIWNHWD